MNLDFQNELKSFYTQFQIKMRQGGNNKQQNEGQGDSGPKADGQGHSRAGASPQGKQQLDSPARNKEGEGGRRTGSPMQVPRKPVTVTAKKSGRNSQSPGKKPVGKRFQMYKQSAVEDDEFAIKDREDSPERTSGMLDQGQGIVEGLTTDQFKGALKMFEKDFGYEDKYNLSKDINASPQANIVKKQAVYVPGYAKARDPTTRVRKDFATTTSGGSGARNPSIALRGKLGAAAARNRQSPMPGGGPWARQGTASPGKSPGRKLAIKKKEDKKEETDLSTVEVRPDAAKIKQASKDRSTGEMMVRQGPLAADDHKEIQDGFEEQPLPPDTPLRQRSRETGNTQRASRAGPVFISGEGTGVDVEVAESDVNNSMEVYDQGPTPEPVRSRLDDIVMHEQMVGDVIHNKFQGKMSLGSHILAQNIIRGREQKALPVELQESSPENLMQRKLQMNQDIKDYQESQTRQQIQARDQAQMQFQSQKLYVNNAAPSSKKRGFSAILGGSGFPAGQAQTGRAGHTGRQMQGQMSYSHKSGYIGSYGGQGEDNQKLGNSQSLGLGPNRSLMRNQQSQFMKMSLKGRNAHGESNKFQSIKSLQTAGTQRRAIAQGGVSSSGLETWRQAQTNPNTWRHQSNLVGSSNYCKFGVKDRFANNRIRGEIQDQFLGIHNAKGNSQTKQRNSNLHLLQTFDPKNNWSNKMLQDGASQQSCKTPLSLLIKQDEMKEKTKLKKREFEERKRKKDEHYKQYIAQMNAHYRQQCAIQNEGASQHIQKISIAEFGSGYVEPGSRMTQGKGAFLESDGAQADQESMVLISDVVGSGIQTLTTPRMPGSEVRMYRSSQLKKRNMASNMQTLGTITSKGDTSQGALWRGNGTQRDVLSKMYHSKVDAREGQGLINQNLASTTQMIGGDHSELLRWEDPRQPSHDTSQNSKSNINLKRGKGSSKLIDVERANRITRRQSDWIKKHTFKLSFQKSATRKADGYMRAGRTGSADYEMIAVHENYANISDRQQADKPKGGAQRSAGKQAQESAQKASATAGGAAEDDGDLSKIISDPVMHGFFDFKSSKWLRKVFDSHSQELTTPYAVPTLGSVVQMGSSVSPRSMLTGPQGIGGQSPAKPTMLLKGETQVDQFATGQPRNDREGISQLMSSLPSPNARSSTSNQVLKLEGVKTNEFLLTHQICPKLYKVEPLQTARGPASPTSALSGNQIMDSSAGVAVPQAVTTPSVSVGGLTMDKRDTSMHQPSILTGTHSTAVPKAQKQTKQNANNKRKNFTQYENMIWKFAEQITLSEWKKAQQISHQGQKIWGHRKQYFAFNFGMQCLIQGHFLQSSQVYEQVLVNEYQKKTYRSLKGANLRKSLLENEIIAASLHNLLLAKLLHIQNLQESAEPENTGSNGEQTMSNRTGRRSIRSKKAAKPSSMSANQQSHTIDPMKKIEIAKDIVNSAQELLDLMEFHGLARMTFTLNQEEINFQKLIAFTKQILKTNKAVLRKDKLEKEAADEILQQTSTSQENQEQEDGSVEFSGKSQDNEEIIKVKMVRRILLKSREDESYYDPIDFKVGEQDTDLRKKNKKPRSRTVSHSDERVDSESKSPIASVPKASNNIREIDETLEAKPKVAVINESDGNTQQVDPVQASRHSSKLTKPSNGLLKQQAPVFLNKQVYLDQGTNVNYDYFRVTNFGALGASGTRSKGRANKSGQKDSRNSNRQKQLSFNPKVYQNKYVIDAEKLQERDKVQKFEDERKKKETVPTCCQPGLYIGKVDELGEKTIDVVAKDNLGTIDIEVEPLITEIKVTSLEGLHSFATKDLEHKYRRRRQRKDNVSRRDADLSKINESQDSQEYGFEDMAESEEEEKPQCHEMDLEDHVLPFPNRNPLLNIREAKKLGNEDVKPELGFGFIKKDELQRNASNVQTVVIQEQNLSKSPPAIRKGSSKSAPRTRSPSKKTKKVDKDGRSASPMKGSAKDSDEPECTCENGEQFVSPFFSSQISDKIFLAINNKGPKEESKGTCPRCDQDSKDLLNLSRVDKCLITMEELEMDVNRILQDQRDDEYDEADQTGDFDANKLRSNELADPVHEQYIQLLQNIKNLCNDESIYSILLDAQKQQRGKPEVTSTFQRERTTKAQQFAGQSAAKDILVRAVLKNHEKTQPQEMDGDETPVDPIEIDKAIFRERIWGIVEAVDEELRNPVKKPRAVSYISLAGEQIKKLLAAARKKRKERERANQASKTDTGLQKTSVSAGKSKQKGDAGGKRSTSQPSIDASMDHASSLALQEISADFEDGFATGGQLLSLQAIFSEMSNLKILFERLGMHSEHFLKSLLDVQKLKKGGSIITDEHPEDELNEEELKEYNAREEKRLLKAQLVGFQTKNDSKIEEFVWRTRDFLAYVFHEWSALFLFQRTQCLSDFFEFAPTKAREYADEVQSTLTTIPLRFSILSSDKMDDAEHTKWEQKEFTYNRNEASYRLISQSLRYQSTMDTLNAYANSMFEQDEDQDNGSTDGVQGLSKQDWIVEVYRKFNFITLLNFAFRECIDSLMTSQGNIAHVNEAELKPDASGVIAESIKRQRRLKSQVKKNQAVFYSDKKSQQNFIPNENLILLAQMYALKKSELKATQEQFDASVIDLILSEGKFDIFNNLDEQTRRKMFSVADHRRIKATQFDLGHIGFPFKESEVLLPLNGEIEVYILKQTSKRQSNSKSKNSKKESSGGTFKWTLFQAVKTGVALPIQSVYRLSALYNMPVKVIFKSHTRGTIPGSSASRELDFDQLHALSFDQHQVAKEVFGPLRRSLMCKIEAQTELNCMFDNNLEGQASQAETSPFLMFVLAIVCQVRVNKYSESVVQKGEIPKGLHLIIDGNAQITYEDTALREIEPSEFCRTLKRPKDSVPFTFGPESPDAEIKGKQMKPKRDVSALSGRKSGGGKSPGRQDGPVVITLGRPKQVNHFTQKKQVPKQWVKQQIEFKSIKKGSYFASRVLIDEAIIKNYIKAHKSTILRWIREPYRLKIESIIRQFTQQQALLSSSVGHGAARQPPGDAGGSPTKYAGSTSGINTDCALLEGDVIRRSMVNLNQEIKLKSEVQTRKEYRFDEDNRSSQLDIDIDQGNSEQKQKDTTPNSPEQPREKEQKPGGAAAFHLENLSKNEYKVMRAFLLSSQLSVIVKSHELKCMVIKKQDKVYFHESIKKIFDERMSAYDFKDIDRPMKEVVQVEKLRQNGRKWELFKRQFEQQILQQSYQERKRLYGKPS